MAAPKPGSVGQAKSPILSCQSIGGRSESELPLTGSRLGLPQDGNYNACQQTRAKSKPNAEYFWSDKGELPMVPVQLPDAGESRARHFTGFSEAPYEMKLLLNLPYRKSVASPWDRCESLSQGVMEVYWTTALRAASRKVIGGSAEAPSARTGD